MAAQPVQRRIPALRLSERRKLLIRPLVDNNAPEAPSNRSRAETEETPSTASRISLTRSEGDDAYSELSVGQGIAEQSGGSIHGDFELGGSLGSGSMTHVRWAKRRADGLEVAVKCMSNPDEEVQAFTREEYRLMCELDHPSILHILGMYEKGPTVWLVMELCRDGSLESYVQSHGALDEARGRTVSFQLFEGVSFLHQKRVVHRDLKPANVLLQESASQLRIADFNSAKRIGASRGSSLMLTDRGTHLYSAPELRFGRLWNERVDIWACGLTLFFMLRACHPFNCEAPGVARLLLSGQLPDIRWGGMNKLVKNAIQQCLTVNMCDRPPAMELLVHPMFSRDSLGSSMESHQPFRRQMTGDISPCLGRRGCAASPALSVKELLDLFVLFPVCGLLSVHVNDRSVVVAAAQSQEAGARCSRDLLLSRTSSGARTVVLGSNGGPSEEAPPRASASAVSDGSTMWQHLALTKCRRTLSEEQPPQQDEFHCGKKVSRPKAARLRFQKFWTTSEAPQEEM